MAEDEAPGKLTSTKKMADSYRESGIRDWVNGSTLGRVFANRDPEVVSRICDRVIETGESLKKICEEKTVPDAPSIGTLFYWRKADPRIDDAIRAAMEARAEMRWDGLEEELKAMFYDEHGDPIDPAAAKVMSQLARTIFDARRFEVSKYVPRAYGKDAPMPKTQLEKLMADGKIQIVKYVEMPPKAEAADGEVKHADSGAGDRPRMPVAGYADTSGVPAGERNVRPVRRGSGRGEE